MIPLSQNDSGLHAPVGDELQALPYRLVCWLCPIGDCVEWCPVGAFRVVLSQRGLERTTDSKIRARKAIAGERTRRVRILARGLGTSGAVCRSPGCAPLAVGYFASYDMGATAASGSVLNRATASCGVSPSLLSASKPTPVSSRRPMTHTLRRKGRYRALLATGALSPLLGSRGEMMVARPSYRARSSVSLKPQVPCRIGVAGLWSQYSAFPADVRTLAATGP